MDHVRLCRAWGSFVTSYDSGDTYVLRIVEEHCVDSLQEAQAAFLKARNSLCHAPVVIWVFPTVTRTYFAGRFDFDHFGPVDMSDFIEGLVQTYLQTHSQTHPADSRMPEPSEKTSVWNTPMHVFKNLEFPTQPATRATWSLGDCEHWQVRACAHFWYATSLDAWLTKRPDSSLWRGFDAVLRPVSCRMEAPWTVLVDTAERPFVRWFCGALTNAACNEVDVQVFQKSMSVAFVHDAETCVAHWRRSVLSSSVAAAVVLRNHLGCDRYSRVLIALPNDMRAIAWIQGAKRLTSARKRLLAAAKELGCIG